MIFFLSLVGFHQFAPSLGRPGGMQAGHTRGGACQGHEGQGSASSARHTLTDLLHQQAGHFDRLHVGSFAALLTFKLTLTAVLTRTDLLHQQAGQYLAALLTLKLTLTVLQQCSHPGSHSLICAISRLTSTLHSRSSSCTDTNPVYGTYL